MKHGRSSLQSAVRWKPSRIIPLVAFALSVAAVAAAGAARATPATGISGSIVANGALSAPIASSFMMADDHTHIQGDVQNIQIGSFAAEPGAQFGWHQHGGPVWVVIKAGTLTLYSGEDPECRGRELPAGTALFEPGNHTHIARNETSEPVELYAVYMLPEGGEVLLDEPAPGNCAF